MSFSTIDAGLTEPALRLMVEEAPDIMVLLQPDGRCRHVSPASLPLLGHPPGALSGTNLRDLVLEDDQHAVGDLLERLGAGERCATVSFRVRRNGGGWVWMEGNARRVPAGAGSVLVLRDITARKQGEAVMEEANSLLRRRACEDPATGLANRGHFLACLERELRRCRRDGSSVALIAAEMDGFALFVDLYGHDQAEEAVCKIADAVRDAMRRPGDLGGRLSGGVLGLMLPGTVAAGAAEVGARLSDAVGEMGLEHAGAPSGFVSIKLGIVYSDPSSLSGDLLGAAEHMARLAVRTS